MIALVFLTCARVCYDVVLNLGNEHFFIFRACIVDSAWAQCVVIMKLLAYEASGL